MRGTPGSGPWAWPAPGEERGSGLTTGGEDRSASGAEGGRGGGPGPPSKLPAPSAAEKARVYAEPDGWSYQRLGASLHWPETWTKSLHLSEPQFSHLKVELLVAPIS